MPTQKVNMMTIDKLLAMLKNSTNVWGGLIELDKDYLTCNASTQVMTSKEKKQFVVATITFSTGAPAGTMGIGGGIHLTLPVDDITAALLRLQAGYALKSINHLAEQFTKDNPKTKE